MARTSSDETWRTVVAGDVSIDWHLPRSRGAQQGTIGVSGQPGEAALLGELVAAVAGDVAKGTGTAIEVLAPEVPSGTTPADERFHHRHVIWACRADAGRAVWRVEEFLGVDRAAAGAGAVPVRDDLEEPGLIVLHDAGLGFRDQPGRWPRCVREPTGHQPWIVLRAARPVALDALWQRLLGFADRLITVLHIDDLRLGEVDISRGLSWERTAQDLLWELVYSPRVNALAQCAHSVVSFGTAGALVLSRAPAQAPGSRERPGCQLVFDPAVTERSWNGEHPGGMIGGRSVLVAGIARQIMTDPKDPDVLLGVQRGISAMRTLHLDGYAVHRDPSGRARLVFPRERIAAELSGHDRSFAEVPVPDPARYRATPGGGPPGGGEWTILEDRHPDGLEPLASRIVVEGPERALDNVPIGRFGTLLTVDRHEIEGFRSIRMLIGEYYRQHEHPRPLSIAVFGPPGSGKSFGVKQVARSVLPGRVEDITFNLSQFSHPDALKDALYRVRDISLGGKLPLVFWDEFDTTLASGDVPQPLGWLRFFLSPMQDGEFQDGQLTHPIGPAVFVFAGGTRARMQDFAEPVTEQFRAAKGPDFVSRLKGYVNVHGPNPAGGDPAADPYYLIRRAVLLRSLLLTAARQLFRGPDDAAVLDIDTGVLRGLLLTSTYRHGARSMESVIAMSTLSGGTRFERSDLPSEAQLDLHVEARDFLDLVHRLELEGELLERLAEATHILYCAQALAAGDSWGEPGDEYLLANPLLTPYAGRERDPGRANPSLVPYQRLPEALKEFNRGFVRDLPRKLAAAGYAMRPARSGEPPLELSEEEVRLLTEQEHERWLVARLAEGWSWAPGPANLRARTSSAMLTWRRMSQQERAARYGPERAARLGDAELPAEEKEKDEKLVRGIASCLSIAGYTAVKVGEPV